MSEYENAANLMTQLEQELGVKGPANVLRAALKIARETASGEAVEAPDPPAWMVEVAREADAKVMDAAGNTKAAEAVRAGHRDGGLYQDTAIIALRLALERGHVVETGPAPTVEPLVKALERIADYGTVSGMHDQDRAPKLKGIAEAALQARRNMLREGAVANSAAPTVDLREALSEAWDEGYLTAIKALQVLSSGAGNSTTLYANEREKDVTAILENLPTREG